MVDLNIELPEGFLEEEIRCGYTVTRQMKEVWAVELDLAPKLMDVCQKNNIKIMTFAGTTLGAIRHKGFIPWDDDIDFIVTRDDYERLCNIASKEFESPYFFQTEYTDPGSLRSHAQLRNSRTTGILKNGEINLSFNQGIFIDIFPIDKIPDDPSQFEKLKSRAQKLNDICFRIANVSTRYGQQKSDAKNKKNIKRIVHPFMQSANRNGKMEMNFFKEREKVISSYRNENVKMVGPISFLPDEKRFYFTTESIKETVMMPFEFTEFPVPIGYEEQLKNAYGDYHKYVVGGSVHGTVLFDTAKPYTDYIRKGE